MHSTMSLYAIVLHEHSNAVLMSKFSSIKSGTSLSFDALADCYRELISTHNRADLADVFGVHSQHVNHFKEAPTLQKFFCVEASGWRHQYFFTVCTFPCTIDA
jgi:hypothetical protein